MKNNALFRNEVFENKKNKIYGSVFINTPPQYVLVTAGLTVLLVLILLFIAFAEFSEKYIVYGYLNSTKAFARVYPKSDGLIVQRYFQQGDRVKKGDDLFLIDTSYAGLDNQKEPEIAEQLQKSKAYIEKEIAYKRNHLMALKKLVQQKYVSQLEYNEKEAELIALKNRKNDTEMNMIKYQQSQSYIIHAPIDGMLSSVLYKQGQYTKSGKPLAQIIPENSELVAELFIPAKNAGFLNKNNQVFIRYDAYPYEHFGSYSAKIVEISQSIMTDDDEDKPIQIKEPYYKVTAELARQCVSVYGEDKKIQHGMTLSAVIAGSKRSVWRWILDPLYSYYGALFK